MKKGIMVPFFTEITMRRRLELMKEAGFDTLMMSIDRNHEKFTAPLEEVIKMCEEIGLKVECAHAAYKDPDVNFFWTSSLEGDKIEQDYMEALKFASLHNIKNVVFHMHFETNYELSEVGIARLKRMVAFAEKNNVNIAIENLYSYHELEYVLSKIDSPNLGICYDCGHENFLTKGAGVIYKYGNRLKALHLHDNDGKIDEHKTPFTGSIDWNYIANGLAQANEVSLEAEVRLHRPEGKNIITEEELLALYKIELNALLKLEALIKKYKLNQMNIEKKLVG